MSRERTPAWRWLSLFILFAYTVAAIASAIANGSVNDEYAAHVTAGYLYWLTGKFAGGVHNPPLGQLWVAWPCVASGIPLTPFSDEGPVLARLANILLGLVGLLLLRGFLIRVAGERAACLGTAALVATPEYVAHASLATLDLPVTVALFGTLVAAERWVRRGKVWLALTTGLLWGVALATKISALHFLPIFAAHWLASRWRISRRLHRFHGRCVPRAVAQALLVAAAALFVIWASYHFRAVQGPHSTIWLAKSGWARIVPQEFLDQLAGKTHYANAGNLSYLAGMVRVGGWWWYYAAVLVLKTPLPLLCLWCIGVFSALRSGPARARGWAAAAMAFLLCASFNRAQIGVRHLLPFAMLVAPVLGFLANHRNLRMRRTAWALLLASAANAAYFLPFPLTAESLLLVGRGYRVFADSNYDWGQANAVLRARVAQGDLVRPAPYEITTGTLAVRVNEWAGVRSRTHEGYAWLRQLQPRARLRRCVLVYDVTDQDLEQLRKSSVSPLVQFGFELAAARARQDLICTPCLTLLDSFAEEQRREAIASWLDILLKQAAPPLAYQAARRLSLLFPEIGETKEAEQRLRLMAEAERLETANLARAAFARANVAWLSGDARQSLRDARSALAFGASEAACAPLIYRAACAMGMWRLALAWGRRVAPRTESMMAPPLSLIERLAAGKPEADDCFQLGMYWYRQRLWPAAARMFMTALEVDSSHAQAFNMLGELVVRYKEETIDLGPRTRAELERLRFAPRGKSR
jgi:4-amino-4-deoxy-L-arabinose transferase-like glycosyltransferase